MVAEQAHQDGTERFEVVNDTYRLRKHARLSEYRAALPRKAYASLYKLAVIRNPWDLVVSHYFSPHRGAVDWNRDAFVRCIEGCPPLRHYIKENRFLDRVRTRVRGWLGAPGSGLDGDLDMLLRFEHLDEDFAVLCERLRIPHQPLPRVNASRRKPYPSYYDDETRDMVRRKFREEVDFGGYRFD